MGMLDGLERRWQQQHRAGVAWQAVASDRIAFVQAAAKAFRIVLQIAMLCAGAWLALEQMMSPGAIVAASIIMGRALAPVELAIGQWRSLSNAREAYKRLQAMLNSVNWPNGARVRLPAPAGRLLVHGVGKRLENTNSVVLQNISFELVPGELLGLIGPSGAGKSTLARLLVGIARPTLGEIRLDGALLADWPRQEAGRYTGYLPQDVELLDGTVAENIARFGEILSDKVIEAARIAGAHEMILGLPQGYETEIGDGGRTLSGGQRQRIGLARAVYNDARLIVLDEPNANLDAFGELALRRALAILKEQKRTVVIITHKASLLTAADKLLVLQDGRVEFFGPREEVAARLGLPASSIPGQGQISHKPASNAEEKINGEAAF